MDERRSGWRYGTVMKMERLRPWQRALVAVWAALAVMAIYVRGQNLALDRHPSSRLQFHAIPMAVSVLYHGRPHDYTAFVSAAEPFQSPIAEDVDTRIARVVASVPPADDKTYYWVADDRGMGDYVIAAFALFGPHTKSLYYAYFVVLGLSVFLFLGDLGRYAGASAMLLFALGALYSCTPVILLGNLTLPIFEAGALFEPRVIDLLTFVSALHLGLTSFFSGRWGPCRRAVVAAQAAILVAGYHARSTVAWQMAFVVGAGFVYWMWRRYADRGDGRANRGRLMPFHGAWPVLCLVVGLCLLKGYQHATYNPRYLRDIGGRTVWHNALMGLWWNQHLAEKYQLRVDDQAIVGAVRNYLSATQDPRLTPEWSGSNIISSLGGHSPFNWFTYEQAARDFYWHIWRSDAREMLRCYLINKPREIVRVLAKARRPDPDVPGATPQNPGLRFNLFARGAILIVLPGLLLMASAGPAIKRTLWVAPLLFLCSAVPAFLFYPVVHTMMGAFATVALTGYLILAQIGTLAVGSVSRLILGSARATQVARALFTWLREREILEMLGPALLTLLVAVYFAPRGFRGGFTDIAHDGYQIRQVLDLDRGGTIFKDTFDQYGPLSGYLNLAAYRTLGRNLLAVKYAICFWYAATAVLLYRLARYLLQPALSAVSVLAWLALAPFYGHGVMISPHAYVLFFQTAATLAVLRFAAIDRLHWLAIAGACCGLSWLLKTSMGGIFTVGVSAYLAARLIDGRFGLSRALTAASIFLGAAAGVVGFALALLAAGGALRDWYLQTVVFPKAFYVDQIGPGTGVFASVVKFARHFLELNFDMTRVPVAVYWHVLRIVVVFGAIRLWFQRKVPDALLLTGCLTPVMWLAAFPSANYMHQWWLTSLTFAPFVYCLSLAMASATQRWAVLQTALPDWLAMSAVLVLVLWSGIIERVSYAWERTTRLTETYDTPAVIRGIRTDKQMLTAFRAMEGAIRNFRQHHPGTRIVSRDHCDGYTNCVPESLLWLSFIEDNPHSQPIYWPVPVLTTKIYPEYERRFLSDVERNRPLIVDSWNGPFRPENTVSGYRLLVGAFTDWEYWYLFAPVHPSADAHGEVQVRIEPPVANQTAVASALETLEAAAPAVEGAYRAANQTAVASALETLDVAAPAVEGAYRAGVRLAAAAGEMAARRLYTWPADVDIPSVPTTLELVDPAAADRSRIVAVQRDRWIVRGFAEAPFSYLLQFKERTVHAGEYFVATGRLDDGGVTIGLQARQKWAGLVNVITPGPFAVVLAPDPGRYALVLANHVTTTRRDLFRRYGPAALWKILIGATLPNTFEIDRAGWSSIIDEHTRR
jgi:hypothetical protein